MGKQANAQELYYKIASEAFQYGYHAEMHKIAETAQMTPEEAARATSLYHRNAVSLGAGGNGVPINLHPENKGIVQPINQAPVAKNVVDKVVKNNVSEAAKDVATSAPVKSPQGVRSKLLALIKENPKTAIGIGVGAGALAGGAAIASARKDRD